MYLCRYVFFICISFKFELWAVSTVPPVQTCEECCCHPAPHHTPHFNGTAQSKLIFLYIRYRGSLINTSKGSRDIDKSRGVFSSSFPPYNLITRFGTDHEVFHCQIMGSSTFYCNCNKEGKYWQELLATEVDRCRYFYFVSEMEKFFPRLLLTTSKLCSQGKSSQKYFSSTVIDIFTS